MRKKGVDFLVLPFATLLLAGAIGVKAADDEDTDQLSFGPLRSDEYYWVPADDADAEYDSKAQDRAIQHLQECRAKQDAKFGDEVILLSDAEEDIRKCMLEHGWTRKWTAGGVIF